MRTFLLPALLAFAGTNAAAATRDFPATGFERVQLDAVADVTVTAGPRFSVHADGDADLVGKLAATVRDGTLYLGWTSPVRGIHGKRLTVAVTMPRVAGAGVKGVGDISVDRAEAPMAVFAVSGTGSVKVASVKAGKTVLSQSGTGSIEVAGATDHLDARNSGTGSIEAGKLIARSATIVGSGVGSVAAHVDGPASVQQSGIGSVTVTGHPSCTVKRSGIGSVDCG